MFLKKLVLCLLCVSPLVTAQNIPLTPFESSKDYQLPSATQVAQYLQQLADSSPTASLKQLGISAGKRPVYALLVSNDPAFLAKGESKAEKPTVMLVGSQHGNEPSGAEALQILAKELIAGNHPALLTQLNLVIVALANPDGRDLKSRYNAARTNPNVDYIAASADETQMYIDALNQYQPHVVYDVHESGVFKRILTKEQGYMTDVQAQFEVGNNPNIYPPLRQYAEKQFLPQLINNVNQAGLAAARYRGEITRLQQSVARGGIGISNFRNYAAMRGTLSVLVENRLDSKQGQYPTPRNIKQRVEKQQLSAINFLTLVAKDKDQILKLTEQARSQHKTASHVADHVFLDIAFTNNDQQKQIKVPLTEVKTGKQVYKTFNNNDRIAAQLPIAPPSAYVVTAETKKIATLLKAHHIQYQVVDKPTIARVERWRVQSVNIDEIHKPGVRDWLDVKLEQNTTNLRLKSGDLIIPTNQLMGRFVTLLFDPRSSTSIYQEQEYRGLLIKYPYLFVAPVKEKQTAIAKRS
ncbi:M14 family zinc carboxypeptidase [Spartinivicinus poritis]|uniref:M14 family zinc carboxypeptidase n=1 Tax=Spartinivicinus poritis TaxID=2994640 RepID=A0ABT5U790_9GAMM|nr:M14 family zinc carboxypeptidase [Spartinivicinus sp. A2-2]MDE1462234.1 M14 family zinc carboxypeptidase [Spartinivicinus sp. A2-2]